MRIRCGLLETSEVLKTPRIFHGDAHEGGRAAGHDGIRKIHVVVDDPVPGIAGIHFPRQDELPLLGLVESDPEASQSPAVAGLSRVPWDLEIREAFGLRRFSAASG